MVLLPRAKLGPVDTDHDLVKSSYLTKMSVSMHPELQIKINGKRKC